ncbi:MAG: adenylate/guanylate cyclase domain-containing protein [Candidatus Dormibacteraeota bacterium]|uniref:Adenylate/guanylate cyclase domain-containing protein n=1 Tax=Candidatus Amunia macphersoniae TaxID=3127014 RepID=A0A934KDA8_9BACT|nr:adenylate/guanylate cyclase domain-containing protein [Candidatus Dormibacteraeota bacterium]
MAQNPILFAAIAALVAVLAGGLVTVVAMRVARRGRDLRDREREREQLQQQALEQEREERRAQEMMELATSGVLALAATIPGVRLATQVARVGVDVSKLGFAPLVAGSLRRIADYAESDRPAIRRSLADDGTLVLMFSDIAGSTSLNERLGDEAWLALLKKHDAIVRRQVRGHRGQVVKTQGDSFMVAFKELADALHCSLAIQHDLRTEEMPEGSRVQVRIGLHRGEVTRQGRDVFGLNVALAARVAAQARGGQTLVSEAVKLEAENIEDVSFGKARTVHFKGFSNAITVFPLQSSDSKGAGPAATSA